MQLLQNRVRAAGSIRRCALREAGSVLLTAVLLCLGWAPSPAHACARPEPAAPHGVLLDADLTGCSEESLLGPERRPRLYAIRSRDGAYHPEREPMLFVHGFAGHPGDFRHLVRAFLGDERQLYVLAFDDVGRALSANGSGLASEVRKLLRARPGSPRRISIVAHSAGGILGRHALNLLSHGADLAHVERIDFFAIDTPWHGYFGPSDQSALGRLRIAIARPFLPSGILDLRAESALFQGAPGSSDAVGRVGLLRYPLPPQVRVHLLFAEEGTDVEDYTEGQLLALGGKIAAYYHRHTPVRGDSRLQNFWLALIGSHSYFPFQEELRRAADSGPLTAAQVAEALHRHFPRCLGDHTTILNAGSAPPDRSLVLLIQSALSA